VCEEVLYVSDTAKGSGYPLNHKENRGKVPDNPSLVLWTEQRTPGAREAGNIYSDFTSLRRKLKIVNPKNAAPAKYRKGSGRTEGEPYYEITYDLVRVLAGKNFKFEARYPSGSGGKVQGVAQICIASTFQPGTK
jgi:hypothetical protein